MSQTEPVVKKYSKVCVCDLANKLIEAGVIPPKCKSATIRLDPGDLVTVEAEYYADERILGIDWASVRDFSARTAIEPADSVVATYEPA